MGNIEYSVHTILIQITNIYESFIQGFGNGITISIGVASGTKDNKYILKVKEVAKKLINSCSIIMPIIILVISLIIMFISLREQGLQVIFFKVLPPFIISAYITMSATYYFSVLRGIRDFKFLAKRNIISSIIKISVSAILSFTSLGIVGVWIGYLIYSVIQKMLSQMRYIKLGLKNDN